MLELDGVLTKCWSIYPFALL